MPGAELGAERFQDFFAELWGYEPFPWQRELARRVLTRAEAPWPEVIALPTSAGKTACLDIAIYALAAAKQANGGHNAPRRIFFVVDRRVIVDEAYERARRLAEKLESAKAGTLKEVAERLRGLAGDSDAQPLLAVEMRGGLYRDENWARNPLQPMIVASTVDQIGSRLLFRGYGRSPHAWPILAGLAGNDALYFLDEAHCAQPFMDTLKAVECFRKWANNPLPSAFAAVVMTATPREGLRDVFRETKPDVGHPVLGPRLRCAKRTTLVVARDQDTHALVRRLQTINKEIRDARGSEWKRRHLAERQSMIEKLDLLLVDVLVENARKLAEGRARAIAIMVNRVATANRVFERLRDPEHHDSVMLTGRMRTLDRDDTVSKWLSQLSATQSASRALDRTVFVVATQTLEVGANLDFDALVTECASLDALRQRFGRLNRAGREIDARGAIIIRADEENDSADDPVYGEALCNTWKWLKEIENSLDFGIVHFNSRLPTKDTDRVALLDKLNSQSPHAPVLLPAQIDCLAQTSPIPEPSPDVSLFLHGPGRRETDVHVCWRADLDPPESFATYAARNDAWLDALTHCPPASAECMPVRLSAMRRWLVGEQPSPGSDVEGASDPDEMGAQVAPGRWIIRWRGREDSEVISDPDLIRPGDVIVIPATLGGYKQFGYLPDGVVLDQGERAHLAARAMPLLRLHPAIVSQWGDCAARRTLYAIATTEAVEQRIEEDENFRESLRTALAQAMGPEGEPLPAWVKTIAGALARERQIERLAIPYPGRSGLILRGLRRLPATDGDKGFSDEDDATASGTVRVTLPVHLQGVRDFARRFSGFLDLPKALCETLALTGYGHDLGKADPRMQALFCGGSPWVGGDLLAKSERIPKGRAGYRRALRQSRYPEGSRHELLSVRLLESAPDLAADGIDVDLLLHLVAAHHGRCRPFAPVVVDDAPRDVRVQLDGHTFTANSATRLERVDGGIPDRYWALTRRYGWWGLAWLEAILRLADHRESEREMRAAEEEAG